MRTCSAAIIGLALGATLLAADGKEKSYRFGKGDAGKVPAGWKAAQTGKGDGSVWKVVADATAPSKSGHVLAQTAEGPKALFNLCVIEDTNYKEVEISVAFKSVKGKEDQGGGILWRYQDANNYYVARFNPLEGNLRVYKVIEGRRTQLDTEEDLKLKDHDWHTLRIEHSSKGEIECYLDGKKVISVNNEKSIDRPGKVGLWTKADAQTYFDDLKVIDRSK